MSDSSFLQAMHARFSTPSNRVVDLVSRVTRRRVDAVQRIVNGYDNEVYQALLRGADPVFVRIRRNADGDFADEADAMDRARRAGVPVPEVVALDRILSDDAERHVMIVTAASGQALEAVAEPVSRPVLCHGDLNPGHVFIDSDRRVSCLIDWGMWHAGTPLGEFAYVWKTFGDDGLDAVLVGHRGAPVADPIFRRSLAVSLCQQQIGHIAHHVAIADSAGVRRNVAFLRRALAERGD